VKRRLEYLWLFPWEFERLASGAQAMICFLMSFGIGYASLRELGAIPYSQWQLLILVPFAGAMIAVHKMHQRHKQLQIELHVARALLHGAAIELEIERRFNEGDDAV
jgi:divalent metal cation (Fe/Co/Zn/Cd) transporter